MENEVNQSKIYCPTRDLEVSLSCRFRGKDGELNARGRSIKDKCYFGVCSFEPQGARRPYIKGLKKCVLAEHK